MRTKNIFSISFRKYRDTKKRFNLFNSLYSRHHYVNSSCKFCVSIELQKHRLKPISVRTCFVLILLFIITYLLHACTVAFHSDGRVSEHNSNNCTLNQSSNLVMSHANQTVIQSLSHLINQWFIQSVNNFINQSINQSTNQPTNQPTNHDNYSIYSMRRSLCNVACITRQSSNQSSNQSIIISSQSVCQACKLTIYQCKSLYHHCSGSDSLHK